MRVVSIVCKQLNLALIALSAVCLMGGVASANLLSNGDFNSPAGGTSPFAAPDDWTVWTLPDASSFANREEPMLVDHGHDNTGNYDGSPQMTFGGTSPNGGAGAYQIVPATAGQRYSLDVDAGVQAWYLPTGEIRLFFLDSSASELASTVIKTTDSLHNPDVYDVGVPYQPWNLSAVAPAGTTQAKVEFAGFGGGSAWFDNASLTAVPEPTSLLLGLCGLIGIVGSRARRLV